MLRKIGRGILYVAKIYFILVGALVTILVARQLYLQHLNTPHEVRAQLKINLDKLDAHFGGPKK